MSGSLIDSFGRSISYLRLSLTDKCNMRCRYCLPGYSATLRPDNQILSFEEIIRCVKIAIGMGITKVRLTGGEPLLRHDIIDIVGAISELRGLADFSLTTNSALLKNYAAPLKAQGLERVNISLDSLDKDKFSFITGGGFLSDVLSGIDEALESGMRVKLNVVGIYGFNDDEIINFINFAQHKKIILRFIELMPLNDYLSRWGIGYLPNQHIKDIIARLGPLYPLADEKSGAAQYYQIGGFSYPIGFISAMSNKFCIFCNRIRITCDGMVLPCLCHNFRINLRTALRDGASDDDIRRVYKMAAGLKPKEHFLGQGDGVISCQMSEIGG